MLKIKTAIPHGKTPRQYHWCDASIGTRPQKSLEFVCLFNHFLAFANKSFCNRTGFTGRDKKPATMFTPTTMQQFLHTDIGVKKVI